MRMQETQRTTTYDVVIAVLRMANIKKYISYIPAYNTHFCNEKFDQNNAGGFYNERLKNKHKN